jgi:hypothetical protein
VLWLCVPNVTDFRFFNIFDNHKSASTETQFWKENVFKKCSNQFFLNREGHGYPKMVSQSIPIFWDIYVQVCSKVDSASHPSSSQSCFELELKLRVRTLAVSPVSADGGSKTQLYSCCSTLTHSTMRNVKKNVYFFYPDIVRFNFLPYVPYISRTGWN